MSTSTSTKKSTPEALQKLQQAVAAAKRRIIPEGRRGFWAQRLADSRIVFIEDAAGPDMNQAAAAAVVLKQVFTIIARFAFLKAGCYFLSGGKTRCMSEIGIAIDVTHASKISPRSAEVERGCARSASKSQF